MARSIAADTTCKSRARPEAKAYLHILRPFELDPNASGIVLFQAIRNGSVSLQDIRNRLIKRKKSLG